MKTTENLYKHMLKPVCEHEDVTVLWNQEVLTDRELTANGPGIIIEKEKCAY
jgi:hypothetical protein